MKIIINKYIYICREIFELFFWGDWGTITINKKFKKIKNLIKTKNKLGLLFYYFIFLLIFLYKNKNIFVNYLVMILHPSPYNVKYFSSRFFDKIRH